MRPARVALVAMVLGLGATLLAGCGGHTAVKAHATAARAAQTSAGGSPRCPRRVQLAVETRREIGRGVGPVATDGSTVWTARPQAGDVIRVTPAGQSATRLGGAPISLTIGFGKLWVARRDADRVVSLDPNTLVQRSAAAVPLPVSVVTGSLGVWALSLDAASLYQLDPASGAGGGRFDAPVASPSDMVMVGNEIWVLGAAEHGLSPFNAKLGRIVRVGFDRPGQSLSGLSSADSTIWLGETAERSLLRVDARSVAVHRLAAPDGIEPTAVAVGDCGLWVADASGDLAIVDPQTAASLGPPIHLGRSLAALAPSGTGVWATDPLDGALVRVNVHSAG